MSTIERIIDLMSKQSVSALQLSKDLSLASGVVTQWKQGKQKPSADALLKIADYFEVSVDYLLGRVDSPLPYSDEKPVMVEPPELEGVYYRLGKEAKQNGISPEDAEKIIELYKKFKS